MRPWGNRSTQKSELDSLSLALSIGQLQFRCLQIGLYPINNTPMFYALLVLAGILGGILAGLIGIGGGIVFVLILPMAFAYLGLPKAEMAAYIIANSLFATTASSMAANVQLWRMGKIKLRPILYISVTAIVVSMIVIRTVVMQDWYSEEVFNVLLFVLLVLMLWRTLGFRENTDNLRKDKELTIVEAGWVGTITGLVQPLSGLGGGIVMIPVLNTVIRMPLKVANGLSLGVVGITSLVNTIGLMGQTPLTPIDHTHTGFVVWPVAIALSAGVMLGSPLGVKWGQTMPQQYVRWVFVAFMSITLIKKGIEIFQAWF